MQRPSSPFRLPTPSRSSSRPTSGIRRSERLSSCLRPLPLAPLRGPRGDAEVDLELARQEIGKGGVRGQPHVPFHQDEPRPLRVGDRDQFWIRRGGGRDRPVAFVPSLDFRGDGGEPGALRDLQPPVSTDAARAWIQESMPELASNTPQVTSGSTAGVMGEVPASEGLSWLPRRVSGGAATVPRARTPLTRSSEAGKESDEYARARSGQNSPR